MAQAGGRTTYMASQTSTRSRRTPASRPAARGSTPSTQVRTEDSHVERDGQDRCEQYKRYAEARASGEVMSPPHLLTGQARREHVRRTLLEDHRRRIHNQPQGAQDKFEVLASDAFTFFRGTALLYYRDRAGTDGHLPIVFTVGDVHPENFGVMPNSDGAPFFGVNDFDEAWTAPFSYDVKRGAVGFWLVAERNGLSHKRRTQVVHSFVDGYLDALRAFAADDRSDSFQFRLDNSPTMLTKILQEAVDDRGDFLAKYVDLRTSSFRSGKKRVAHSSHTEEFQQVVDRYVAGCDLGSVPRPDDFFTVLDVARKKGSGTGSMGLDRYWVLLQGWGPEPERSVVLELKQARRSALYGLVPRHAAADDDAAAPQGERVVHAQQVHLVNGDPLYGSAEIEGTSFMVRERSPFKYEVDTARLDRDSLVAYAGICGQALAQPHARSDAGTGDTGAGTEHQILASVHPALFRDDVVVFAEETAARVATDFGLFRRDRDLGAFRYWDVA